MTFSSLVNHQPLSVCLAGLGAPRILHQKWRYTGKKWLQLQKSVYSRFQLHDFLYKSPEEDWRVLESLLKSSLKIDKERRKTASELLKNGWNDNLLSSWKSYNGPAPRRAETCQQLKSLIQREGYDFTKPTSFELCSEIVRQKLEEVIVYEKYMNNE